MMDNEPEVEMKMCEYCQEYIPVCIKTGDNIQGCINSLCPFEIFDEGDRTEPLDFNNDEVAKDEQFDYSGLVEDSEDGG